MSTRNGSGVAPPRADEWRPEELKRHSNKLLALLKQHGKDFVVLLYEAQLLYEARQREDWLAVNSILKSLRWQFGRRPGRPQGKLPAVNLQAPYTDLDYLFLDYGERIRADLARVRERFAHWGEGTWRNGRNRKAFRTIVEQELGSHLSQGEKEAMIARLWRRRRLSPSALATAVVAQNWSLSEQELRSLGSLARPSRGKTADRIL